MAQRPSTSSRFSTASVLFVCCLLGPPHAPALAGENLLLNPSLEVWHAPQEVFLYEYPEGRPGVWVRINYDADYHPDSTQVLYGQRSVRIVRREQSGGLSHPLVAIRSATPHVLSFYARPEDPLTTYQARGTLLEYDCQFSFLRISSQTAPLTGGWQRFVLPLTTHPAACYGNVIAAVEGIASAQPPSISWLDGVQLEEADTASGFNIPVCDPAPGVAAGRFASLALGQDVDKSLRHADGSPILPSEVPAVYGTPDGFTLLEDGVPAGTWAHSAARDLSNPKRVVHRDLSDATGWPDAAVEPDTLAIDPALGRFALFAGDCEKSKVNRIVGAHLSGFAIPGHGYVRVGNGVAYMPPGEGAIQTIDVSDPNRPAVLSEAFSVEFTSSLDVHGNMLYVSGPGGLRSVDVTDAAHPVWPGGIPQHRNLNNQAWRPSGGGDPVAVRVSGDLAYAGVQGGTAAFYVLDLSSEPAVVERSAVSLPGGPDDLFLDGTRVYVRMAGGGAAIVDVLQPDGAFLAGLYDPPVAPADTPHLIGVAGPGLMAMSRRRVPGVRPEEVFVVDASDPADLREAGAFSFNDGMGVHFFASAAYRGSHLYVSDGVFDCTQCSVQPGWEPTRLIVFDVSDPNTLMLVNQELRSLLSFRHLTVDGDRLYVNAYNYGLRIYDVSDSGNPGLIGQTATAAEGHFAWVNDSGTLAFLDQTFGGSVRVIDSSNPASPARTATYWDGLWHDRSRTRGRGDVLYLPTLNGISIVDASDPAAPVKAGTLPQDDLSQLHVFGDTLFVGTGQWSPAEATFHYKLKTYALADPRSPVLSGELDLATSPTGNIVPNVFVSGRRLYAVVTQKNMFFVVDVGDPCSPVVEGWFQDAGNFTFTRDSTVGGRFAVGRGHAYVITGEENGQVLHIVDVRDPARPAFVRTMGIQGFGLATDVVISGRYMYLARYGEFDIWDITDPVQPRWVRTGDVPSPRWALGRLLGRYLYTPDLGALYVVDVLRSSESLTGSVTASAHFAPDLLRGPAPYLLSARQRDVDTPCLLDEPGSLGDGLDYFYRIEEYGGPERTIRVETEPAADAVRICME